MALTQKSLLLYGLQITELNRSLDFTTDTGAKQATLKLGFYSLGGLATEVARAMFEADPLNIYASSVNRNVGGGLENRVSISSTGALLSLDFGTGPRVASSVAPLIGYNASDYTGATSYTGSTSAGTRVVPDFIGYNFLGPEFQRKVFGSTNVSVSGLKESVVFQIQQFTQVEFKYEPKSKVLTDWTGFFNWAIQQRPFEFTPEISEPTTVHDVTLEKTDYDGKGLGYRMKEMLPAFPDRYTTGLLIMRLTPQ